MGTPESIVSFNENPLAFNMDPRFRQIVASCAGEFARKTPQGHHRYIHHLGGSAKGVLRVLDNPNLPSHDILKPGSTYPVVLRCSTGNSKDDDRYSFLNPSLYTYSVGINLSLWYFKSTSRSSQFHQTRHYVRIMNTVSLCE